MNMRYSPGRWDSRKNGREFILMDGENLHKESTRKYKKIGYKDKEKCYNQISRYKQDDSSI